LWLAAEEVVADEELRHRSHQDLEEEGDQRVLDLQDRIHSLLEDHRTSGLENELRLRTIRGGKEEGQEGEIQSQYKFALAYHYSCTRF